MNNFIIFGVLVLNCLVCAYSQILLKQAAQSAHHSFLGQYLNFKVIFAYSLFFAVLVVNSLLMKKLPLVIISPISESLPFVFTIILSWLILGERIIKKKILGSIIISLGIIIIFI